MDVFIAKLGQTIGFSFLLFVIWGIIYLIWKFFSGRKNGFRPYVIDIILFIAISAFVGRLTGILIGAFFKETSIPLEFTLFIVPFVVVLLALLKLGNNIRKEHQETFEINKCKNAAKSQEGNDPDIINNNAGVIIKNCLENENRNNVNDHEKDEFMTNESRLNNVLSEAIDGNAEAQYQLGMMYLIGLNVEQNIDMALIWLKKAAEQDHEQAKKDLELISSSKIIGKNTCNSDNLDSSHQTSKITPQNNQESKKENSLTNNTALVIQSSKKSNDKVSIILALIVGLVFLVILGGLVINFNQRGEKQITPGIVTTNKNEEKGNNNIDKVKPNKKVVENNIVYVANDFNSLSSKILKKHYGQYNKKYNCWMTEVDEYNRFCMKIERIDYTSNEDSLYVYILAKSSIFSEENGAIGGCHFCSGMIGVFVARHIGNNQYQIVAKNSQVFSGYWGEPPQKWNFLRLGKNSWGWQSETGTMAQGNNWINFVLLVPFKNMVKDSYIPVHYDYENSDGLRTNLNAIININYLDHNKLIYPILSTVSGVHGNYVMDNNQFMIYFDDVSGKYKVPDDYRQLFGDM